MLSDSERLDILKKVLESLEFSHSTRNQELLKYLLKASESKRVLTELDIATEFFGKDPDFNTLEDATVRVNISKLRKRLKNYYLDEGKGEKIQIHIPKGHYDIRFQKKNENYIYMLKNNIKKLVLPFLTLLLLFIAIYFGIQNHHLNKKIEVMPKDNLIWNEFLEDTRPTLVVLGDYFFMYLDRPLPNPRFNVRDPRINSLEDFKEYSKQGPQGIENLKPLRHTYLRPSAVWGFMDLLPILKSSESSFLVKQSSEIDWEDISSHNVIFMGTFKQLYILKTLLKNINVDFSIYPNFLFVNNENGEEVHRFTSTLNDETRQYDDVSLIAKFKGPNNNTIMLITGFEEGGVIYGSKAIANPEFLNLIPNININNIEDPLNFRSILKVEGYLRSEFSSKIEFFEILE